MSVLMPKIQNISMTEARVGVHICADNAVLIQIVDPAYEFPETKYPFSEVHQFEFLDCEADAAFDDDFKITAEQAAKIVDVLKSALERGKDVIVHCHAGVCRSGAVAEVGVMMGFEDAGRTRIPNLMVKHALMKVLGWTYD